jgi:hypothetical protein
MTQAHAARAVNIITALVTLVFKEPMNMTHTHQLTEQDRMMREDFGNNLAWEIWGDARELEAEWPRMNKEDRVRAAEHLMDATAIIYDLLGQVE